MTTTVTTQHHRTPWIASAAVATVIAGAGIVAFAWNASNDSASGNQAPAPPAPTAQPFGGVDGHVPPPPPQPPLVPGGRMMAGQ